MSERLDQALLTAYALGELDDARRRHVEAHLDAAGREVVAEVRATAELMQSALKTEAAEQGPGLDDMRRAAITGMGPRVTGTRVPSRNQLLREAAQSVRDEYGPTPVYHVIAPATPPGRHLMPWLTAIAALLLVAALGLLWTAAQEKATIEQLARRDVPLLPVHAGAVNPADEQSPQMAQYQAPSMDVGDVRPLSDPNDWKLNFTPAEARQIAQGDAHDARTPERMVGVAPAWPDVKLLIEGAKLQPSDANPGEIVRAWPGLDGVTAVERPQQTPQGPAQSGFNANADMARAPLVVPVPPQHVISVPAHTGPVSQGDSAAQAIEETRASMAITPRPVTVPDSDLVNDQHNAAPVTGRSFAAMFDNKFLDAAGHPESIVSMYVENGTYMHLRHMLALGRLPAQEAVRIEEWVNYFDYQHPVALAPTTGPSAQPFAVDAEVAACPWNTRHRLVRMSVTARPQNNDARAADNLVLLVDVSPNMQARHLGALKSALQDMVAQLGDNDHLGIVAYGPNGASVALASTTLASGRRSAVQSALDHLEDAAQATSGRGIELAYSLATQNVVDGGVNRVVVLTDGGSNVGIKKTDDLLRLITDRTKAGLTLSVVGVGVEPGSDAVDYLSTMAQLGHARYTAADTLWETRTALLAEVRPETAVASNVKIHVAFNTARVAGYRLIGFDKGPADASLGDDDTTGGPVQPGQSVTALYEVAPVSAAVPHDAAPELLSVHVRYDEVQTQTTKSAAFGVTDMGKSLTQASGDFKFAAAVSELGMLLRQSPYKGNASFDTALKLARDAAADDASGKRAEFIEMVQKAATLSK